MKRIIRLIGKMAFPALVFCLPEAAFADWTAWSSTTQIIATDTSGLNVVLPNAGNPSSCASTTWYRLMPSVNNYQVIAATLMSAAAQGKQVQVWASSCASDGATLILGAQMKM